MKTTERSIIATKYLVCIIPIVLSLSCSSKKYKQIGLSQTSIEDWRNYQKESEAYGHALFVTKEKQLLDSGILKENIIPHIQSLIDKNRFPQPYVLLGDSLDLKKVNYQEYKDFRKEQPIDSILLEITFKKYDMGWEVFRQERELLEDLGDSSHNK